MTAFFNTGLSQAEFLSQYWQKKPLLIRNALTDFVSPISVDELAGLACEQGIESRLIEEHGQSGPWQCQHGPFDETLLAGLPDKDWTLLVQDVDKHWSSMAALWKPFEFIPQWRRDDFMVSYAPVGGSVGPHTDGYDVFLIQAMGTRRWQISDAPVTEAQLLPDLELRILAEFEPAESWDLQPGDILYLPPHFAHHGVAQTPCMTISAGFRSATQAEMLDQLLNNLLEAGKGGARCADADLTYSQDSAEIDGAVLQRVKQQLHQFIDQSDAALLRSVGQLVTETKPSLLDWADNYAEQADEPSLQQGFAEGNSLQKTPFVRLAWYADEQQIFLFCQGEAYGFTSSESMQRCVQQLAEAPQLSAADWQQIQQHPELVEIVVELVSEGVWFWAESN
jgi:50S ribosomal protein L16 3-hydroxylase